MLPPPGVKESDYKYPDYKSKDQAPKDLPYEDHQFDIWYTDRFGWVIPTLHIRNASLRNAYNTPPRTYAISTDGKICTVGLGPHVKERHTVYVRKSRFNDLKKYIELRHKGQEDANSIRDRISTRRANTILRRNSNHWNW